MTFEIREQQNTQREWKRDSDGQIEL